MNNLRAVLARVEAGRPGTTLAGIARELGIGRDEVEAIVDYWVGRGRLEVNTMASCPASGCAGCRLRSTGCGAGATAAPPGHLPPGTGTRPGTLITVTPRRT
ncbi:FeoC-like transcriptional regulator [Streptomyces sp. GC420]|uniref:FeoC-like transcriptional regulator n=1 Tax=Streptomyces sp. GC420 TaxID=2697568 RepID=UPI001414DD82|nr:FeoC-like transcriptional regulator [Streptomyces sp. GC420]NBM20479.1 hypothetical protein [Streptomyces sp. GC420]